MPPIRLLRKYTLVAHLYVSCAFVPGSLLKIYQSHLCTRLPALNVFYSQRSFNSAEGGGTQHSSPRSGRTSSPGTSSYAPEPQPFFVTGPITPIDPSLQAPQPQKIHRYRPRNSQIHHHRPHNPQNSSSQAPQPPKIHHGWAHVLAWDLFVCPPLVLFFCFFITLTPEP